MERKKAEDLVIGDLYIDNYFCYEVISAPQPIGLHDKSSMKVNAIRHLSLKPELMTNIGVEMSFILPRFQTFALLNKEWLKEAWHNEAKLWETLNRFQNLRHALEEKLDES